MACECAIVASDTSPLHEAITDGKTGKLVDFFNDAQLAKSVIELLQDPKRRAQLGAAARQHVITHYDLKRVCLPELVKLIHTLGHQPQV
jgi:glycosyltransferase involved in cell wall biosynthesis